MAAPCPAVKPLASVLRRESRLQHARARVTFAVRKPKKESRPEAAHESFWFFAWLLLS
jgi:hypothetical protein